MKTILLTLGNTHLSLEIFQKNSPCPTFINVHEDEVTSIAAGKTNIEKFGGRLIKIMHAGSRLITFTLDGAHHSFDPNRIFSDAGITATLKKHSAYSPAAHAVIKTFAENYLRELALEKEPVIIALHNTVDGIFSVESFAAKGDLASDAAAVHISPQRSKFDFFFVTTEKFFDELKSRDFNVVLQNNDAVTDDGSLSVHFAKAQIPYINVEAQMPHLSEQIQMLEAVRQIIGM